MDSDIFSSLRIKNNIFLFLPDFSNMILPIFLALLPAIFWLVIWYKKDKKEPEPKQMILLSFCLGFLAALPFFILQWQVEHSPNLLFLWNNFSAFLLFPAIIGTIALAFLEETAKHFAVLRLGSRLRIHFNQIVDGIIYSVSAALGFAFAENIAYFFTLLTYYSTSSPEFWNIYAFRSLGTLLGHTLFSGVFGLFWGHAFLSQSVTSKHSVSVKSFFRKVLETLRFHIIFSHILQARQSLRGHEKSDLVREALFLATIIHVLFNLLLMAKLFGHSLTFLVVPLLLFLFVFLGKQFLVPRNVRILHPIET